MLVIEPTGLLATDYRVSREGTAVTTIVDTQGPMHGHFVWQGARYEIGGIAPSALPVLGIAQAVFRAVTGRRLHALRDASGETLAKARERGWGHDSYDVQIDGLPSALTWDKAADAFRWRFIGGGSGVVSRIPQRARGVQAALPDTMTLPVQVFIALLALQRWEFLSRGGD
jgi:hypothetical protein